MKQLFLITAAFLISSAVMSQDKSDEAVKFNTTKYDFGKIKQNVPAVYYFEITNNGAKPLVIESATASCGCTVPEYPKEPIESGKTAKIKVQYNAAALGHFDKDVTIKLAGIQEPKMLKIVGDVIAPSK